MLTIKHRYDSEIRRFHYNPGFEPIEQTQSPTHPFTIESKSLTKHEKIDDLNDKALLERITKLEEESETIRRENLLFARYLLRTNTSKIMESFNDYENENGIIKETMDQMKLIESTRKVSLKKSINTTTDGNPLWTKRSVIVRAYANIQYIPPIDQDRFVIATYEVEQTHLDWQRMKTHAATVLDNLKILFQNIQSDEEAQKEVNFSLQRRVDRYRRSNNDQYLNNSYYSVPGEVLLSRANQQINARTSHIGAFVVNSLHINLRILEIDERIRQLEDATSRIHRVDIDLRKQKFDQYSAESENLNRIFIREKAFLHELIHILEDLKADLLEQETILNKTEKHMKDVEHHLEQTMGDIDFIEKQNNKMSEENNIIKTCIDDTLKVPTITEYAHVIKQLKDLKYDIDIWSQRVTIAETLCSQLKQQNKAPMTLPPLKKPTTIKHKRLIKTSHQ
ncbi:unnamed protein product [Rotaria magnacalcarata]|uniref:Uncharacterized protein n=2 Tax=Rotaria magnacalcarata TaxID=392030 RepID=A0A816MET8_9BILA|nr:unnamed protein product [Rotaria magnacalcarata]CAF1975638.1 unnamed protein product [Rotaria magnacalcarata]CAF4035702.1 unnamed protein product [Rotaria magnacalcarata]CAF4054980.1 unnamed protein product [Rotaria magnacalcarata]